MKDVLLVICPPVWHKLPPLGLAYISEYLKSDGNNVDVIDLNVEDISIVDVADNYDFIGFSVFKGNQRNTFNLIKKIKSKKSTSKAKIILGGPQCFSWQYTPLEFPMVQYIKGKKIKTPVFYSIKQAMNKILTGFIGYPEEIQYADSIVVGDALPGINERPFPTFSGFKLERYERKRALPILAGRGCIRKCAFCSERLLSKGYTARSPEKILEEIIYHKRTNLTKWFTFHDSLINGDLKQSEKLCDLLAEEDIKWDAQAIIRKDMPENLLDKMRKSGCFNLFIGLETGSSKILKLMNKRFSTQDAEVFFRKCKAVGLHFEVSLIAGFPGEGEEEFNETLNFIKRNREYIPKIAQINPFIKYPGTKLREVPINTGMKRVEKFIKFIEDLGIKYTPAFVNNLITTI